MTAASPSEATPRPRRAGRGKAGAETELRRCRHGGVWEPYQDHSFKCSKCGDVGIGWDPDDFDDDGNPSVPIPETITKREVVIQIPMSPSPALSPNARRRGNVWAQREATKLLRDVAWAAARDWFLTDTHRWNEPLADLVDVHEHIVWPRSLGTLPDPDALPTYCKAALDGIVDAGLIAGDSAKHVRRVSASQEKGSDVQGKIIITITEVEH